MDCSKGIFYKALCFVVLLTAKPLVVYSNDSIEIKSTTTGQNIYEVVFESDRKNTTDGKPGVYAIHRDGSQTPVILGNVLGVSRGFNGILAQTSQGATSDTADSIAVVNGKLVLFNKNTSSTGAKSKKALVLGDSKFSIFDPLLGIPYGSKIEIDSLDEISIKAVENVSPRDGLANGGNLFIASIKQRNGFGDGITLAFIVEKPRSDGSQPRIYQDRAVVLGYNFVHEKALEYLVVKDTSRWKGQLFSHNAAKATLQKLIAESSDPLISRWVRYMKDFVRKLESEKSLSQYSDDSLEYLRMGVPVFDMFTEQTVYRGIPARPLMSGDILLYQVYDPRTSLWSVVETANVVKAPKLKEAKSTTNRASDLTFLRPSGLDKGASLQGRVDYDQRKQYRVLPLDPKNKDLTRSEYLIVVGDSTVILLRDQSRRIKTLRVDDLDLSNARNIEVVHSHHYLKTGQIHYLFLSITLKTGKQTLTVLTLNQTDSGFRIVGNTRLMDKHVSRDEILLRSRFTHSDDVSKAGLYFDTAMPVKGAAHYKKSLIGKKNANAERAEDVVKKITPYFFLPVSSAENASSGKKAFLKAAKMIEGIGNGVMTFLQFGDKKLESSSPAATGFYIDYHTGPEVIQPETLDLGEPIFLEDFEGKRLIGKPLYVNT